MVFKIGAVSTQEMMANLYYSKDPTFATKTQVSYRTSVAARVGKPAGVFLNSSKLDSINFAPTLSVNEGEQFYLRFYPWVDSSSSVSGKYIALQNVVVYATAIPIPVKAGATWPLLSSGTAVVSGLVSAGEYYTVNFGGSRFSSGVYFYTLEVNRQRIVKRMLLLK